MKLVIWAVILLFAAGLVAIENAAHAGKFEAPPVGKYTFAPPKDWVEVNPQKGLLGPSSARVWQPKDRDHFQTISLAFTTAQHVGQENIAMNETVKGINRHFRPGNVLKSEVSWSCHRTQKVIFIESRAAIPGFEGFASIVNQVQSLAPYGTYIVTYSRPANEKEDTSAVSSLFSICKK